MGLAAGRGTADGQRRGVFDVDEDRALEALDLAWGAAYDIRVSAGQWGARRLGGAGTDISCSTPDELNAAIRADWAFEATP